MLKMLEHLIGIIVATAVDRTPHSLKIPQTVILAVAGSATHHGIAVQLRFLRHAAGFPA